MKIYSENDLLRILQNRVRDSSQKQTAIALGFTPQFINDVLAQRRPVTTALADALGFNKVQAQ